MDWFTERHAKMLLSTDLRQPLALLKLHGFSVPSLEDGEFKRIKFLKHSHVYADFGEEFVLCYQVKRDNDRVISLGFKVSFPSFSENETENPRVLKIKSFVDLGGPKACYPGIGLQI